VLKPECERFQRLYEHGRGTGHVGAGHLEECEECRRFAAFVDGLSRLGLASPLGDELRARLRGVPEATLGVVAFPRVPSLPLPARLEQRLRRIARQGIRETLPIWIRSPRYAIAASYLLALLVTATVGNPAAWAGEAGERLDRFGSAWVSVRATGLEAWSGVEEATRESLSVTEEILRVSGSSLRARWLELVDSLQEPETSESESPESENDASI
jgi:hypothetical protein